MDATKVTVGDRDLLQEEDDLDMAEAEAEVEDEEEIKRYFIKLMHLVPSLDTIAPAADVDLKNVDKLLANDRVIQSIIDYIKDLESKLAAAAESAVHTNTNVSASVSSAAVSNSNCRVTIDALRAEEIES